MASAVDEAITGLTLNGLLDLRTVKRLQQELLPNGEDLFRTEVRPDSPQKSNSESSQHSNHGIMPCDVSVANRDTNENGVSQPSPVVGKRTGSKRKLARPVRVTTEIVSDREVLLNYYKELLLQNEISSCKSRKMSESDVPSTETLITAETRNAESSLDSPTSSPGVTSDSDVTPTKPVSSPTPSSSPISQGGPEQGSYPCNHCEKSFAYIGNLKRHIKMHHGEYRPYKCSLCVKRFWGNDSLEQHVKRVHSRDKPYACAHCEKKYSVCYDLQKHVRSVHGKDIDWQAAVPTKPLEEESNDLNANGEKCKVTGIKTQALHQLNYKCKFCGRGFATVNGLGVHLKMHFRCRVCFKGFNTEESLRIHLNKAHNITADQEYVL